MRCARPECTGTIVDGYCDVCGMAPASAQPSGPASAPASPSASASAPAPAPASGSAPAPAAGSTRTTASASRRTGTAGTRTGSRSRLGAGLVEVPDVPFRDPTEALMRDPNVPENRRFCARCDSPVGRGRDGQPGRTSGFCRKCGAAFSFHPKLAAGDVVAGQYQVVGCVAHGGMGWVYLARDRNVSDRWVVLKGLLNTGDDDAMAAALAEREFLAEVEHPNIVKIFNFVQHESSGYIVMEYVGGRSLKQILAARREANAGEPDPIPVQQAIAYMLEVLPALGYLHELGLLFCDFKLDNVIQTRHSLKLIDLGGVYLIDQPSGAVFGTVGYQAPEIAALGPSISSDLFTVARTLAVMCFDFRGYQGTFKFTLPPQDAVPLLQQSDSLYRLLLKGTAPSPDDRFQSAEEMAGQLDGVLREVVAEQTGKPAPAASALFTGPQRSGIERPDWQMLPRPQVAGDDPGAGYLATIIVADPQQQIAQLRAAPQHTVEVQLRLAATLTEVDDFDAAEECLGEIEGEDPWEWRTGWYRGVIELAREQPQNALARFRTVYNTLPGELAPKLALGVAAERAGEAAEAASWYQIVSRSDPAFTGAAFGLARCRLAAGDRAGALDAYARVPDASSAYLEAQVARIRCLGSPDRSAAATLEQLLSAGSILEGLPIEGEQRARLTAELLESALSLTENRGAAAEPSATLLGSRVVERDLRFGLERTYRALARGSTASSERIGLVDRANRVRPRTWT
jgi:serine/threonine-protein kinase PknG